MNQRIPEAPGVTPAPEVTQPEQIAIPTQAEGAVFPVNQNPVAEVPTQPAVDILAPQTERAVPQEATQIEVNQGQKESTVSNLMNSEVNSLGSAANLAAEIAKIQED